MGHEAAAPIRTLVVSAEYPWPVNAGSRLRLTALLAGLVACGPTDLFSVVPTTQTDIDPPDPSLGLARIGTATYDKRPPDGPSLLATAAHPSTPFEFPRSDGGAVARDLARFAFPGYDLVWYFRIIPFVLAGGLVAAPAVIDLDDLEDQKILARMAIPAREGGATDRARRLAARAFSAEEARRWRRLQRAAADAVQATVVCSELDAGRARATGLPRVEVVPNGYPVVERPVGRTAVGDPPTVLFQGLLRYPPNAEAARFLVGEVAPRLRALVPGTRIRLVGAGGSGLASLDDPPDVTMVGQVPDIAEELAAADLVVVPLRFGSGTRLKILEAFAQRVPVVSTTLGAEGLGVEDGVHLLLADSADALATACARLLADEGLRADLVDAAHELFLERYTDRAVAAAVGSLARRVAGRPELGA